MVLFNLSVLASYGKPKKKNAVSPKRAQWRIVPETLNGFSHLMIFVEGEGDLAAAFSEARVDRYSDNLFSVSNPDTYF